MLSWRDEMFSQEHHKDLLHEAEQERLARQVLNGQQAGVWGKVKELFSRVAKMNSTTQEKACPTCPAATDIAI